MFITNNYALLTRNNDGPGLQVHACSSKEFVHLTFRKCKSLDNDFDVVGGNVVEFRIMIGNSDVAILQKMDVAQDSILVPNLPVNSGEEIWVACTERNQYCVYGHTTKHSL